MAISKKSTSPSPPASGFLLAEGVKDRSLLDWTERESDKLIDWILAEDSKVNIYDIANSLRREPMSVIGHILSGEIPEMLGFECNVASEEECEIVGLALSGVPIRVCFLWCLCSEDRPSTQQLSALMSVSDMRPHMNLVRETGMWVSDIGTLAPLEKLLSYSTQSIRQSVDVILTQFDAPTPVMVLRHLAGEFRIEKAPVIKTPQVVSLVSSFACEASTRKKTPRGSYPKSTGAGTGQTKAQRRYWAKRKSYRR